MNSKGKCIKCGIKFTFVWKGQFRNNCDNCREKFRVASTKKAMIKYKAKLKRLGVKVLSEPRLVVNSTVPSITL